MVKLAVCWSRKQQRYGQHRNFRELIDRFPLQIISVLIDFWVIRLTTDFPCYLLYNIVRVLMITFVYNNNWLPFVSHVYLYWYFGVLLYICGGNRYSRVDITEMQSATHPLCVRDTR